MKQLVHLKEVKTLTKREQFSIKGGNSESLLMGTCCINGQQIDWPLTKKCAKTYCYEDDPNILN